MAGGEGDRGCHDRRVSALHARQSLRDRGLRQGHEQHFDGYADEVGTLPGRPWCWKTTATATGTRMTCIFGSRSPSSTGDHPMSAFPVPAYSIAPGIQPGFWVFVPKAHGMATKNFESFEANALLRVPSPTIRVEAGDRVRITLENTHYLPHTIHLHGVDHPYYLDHPLHGEPRGNDGYSETSHIPVMPGESFTYEFTPRQPGTQLYHCHEQAPIHVGMGLMGIFVVEENRTNNWLQTLNIGAGHVRHPSVAVKEAYAKEYDLIYQEVDKELHDLIKVANDPRLIGRLTTREYDVTQATPEYFLLNGRSFPYTLRESLIVVDPNEKVKI